MRQRLPSDDGPADEKAYAAADGQAEHTQADEEAYAIATGQAEQVGERAHAAADIQLGPARKLLPGSCRPYGMQHGSQQRLLDRLHEREAAAECRIEVAPPRTSSPSTRRAGIAKQSPLLPTSTKLL